MNNPTKRTTTLTAAGLEDAQSILRRGSFQPDVQCVADLLMNLAQGSLTLVATEAKPAPVETIGSRTVYFRFSHPDVTYDTKEAARGAEENERYADALSEARAVLYNLPTSAGTAAINTPSSDLNKLIIALAAHWNVKI
jgi:hypothetical protein